MKLRPTNRPTVEDARLVPVETPTGDVLTLVVIRLRGFQLAIVPEDFGDWCLVWATAEERSALRAAGYDLKEPRR